jgi:hypothetical protein
VGELRSRSAKAIVAGITLAACLAGCEGHPARDLGPSAGPDQSSASSETEAPALFDLGRDFSFTANPNGPWRYGYTRGAQLARSAFTLATVAELTTPVGFWHPGPGRAGYYPYIAAGLGPTVAIDPTGSWAVRPGEVALEASETGQLAVIEFTVPRAGSYAIAADFAGIHKGLSTTDVHVLLNEQSLFTATISGYGGDPAFYPREGVSPNAEYRVTHSLRAGDVLTFAIGFGPNLTHYNDTTGLIVTIRTAA